MDEEGTRKVTELRGAMTIMSDDDISHLWTHQQCAEYTNLDVTVWRNYVLRKQVPQPVTKVSGRPYFDPEEVKEWNAGRPHAGGRPRKTKRK